MNFLSKIKKLLFTASTSIEKAESKLQEHDEKYNTASTRKACIIVAIFVVVLAAIVAFIL